MPRSKSSTPVPRGKPAPQPTAQPRVYLSVHGVASFETIYLRQVVLLILKVVLLILTLLTLVSNVLPSRAAPPVNPATPASTPVVVNVYPAAASTNSK